jgi:hypothetical protein
LGQNLLHHHHVHCVVPGEGMDADGQHWIACRPGFFLPVRVLSRLFRRLFLEQLRHTFDTGALHFHGKLEPLADAHAFSSFLAPSAQAEWVVYAKPPFGDAQHVLNYLGRYTHRVAISNNRLMRFDGDDVTFGWKDYRHDAAQKTMTLTADEFIRRFLLMCCPTVSNTFAVMAYWPIAIAWPSLPPAAGFWASSSPPKKRPTEGTISVNVTSDSPASRYAIARCAATATWCASKPSCLAHCRVHRRARLRFTDPCFHHYRSRFHSFLMATRPGLRHRVFAVCQRPKICVIHLAGTALAPPSRDARGRFIVAQCPANACGRAG